ncbi:MAG: hypothetical protein HY840_10895 [Bacteroidetes bacterium]|nr:hypothetical protein [Bacteroidota bacterium]
MKAISQTDTLEKKIIKVIKETIKEELMNFRTEFIPYISDEEQKEIEKLYKKPNTDIVKSRKVKI